MKAILDGNQEWLESLIDKIRDDDNEKRSFMTVFGQADFDEQNFIIKNIPELFLEQA